MRSIALLAVLLLSLPARAQEDESPAVLPYLTVGGLELVGVTGGPAHLGFFGMAQVDLLVPLKAEGWTFISSTGFEMAPDNGNWGFYQFIVLDRVLGQAGSTVITIEPQVGLVHNAVPLTEGFNHAVYPTAGLGFAVLTQEGVGPAIIPTVTASYGLQGEGLSLAVMVLYSVPIP